MSVKDLTPFSIYSGYHGEPSCKLEEFKEVTTLYLVDAREIANEILEGYYTPAGYNAPDFVRIFCDRDLIEEVE